MKQPRKLRVGINGYGVIGRRVGDAVTHWEFPSLFSRLLEEKKR